MNKKEPIRAVAQAIANGGNERGIFLQFTLKGHWLYHLGQVDCGVKFLAILARLGTLV